MGYPPCHGKWFARFGHYIYGNQNAVTIYGGRAPFHFSSPADLAPQIPRLREEFRWVQELPVSWMRDLDRYLIRLGEFMSAPVAQMNERELWAHIEEIVAHGVRYFRPNIAISITQAVLCSVLARMIALVAPQGEARPLLNALLAWTETKTGQINKELFELGQIARMNPALEAMLRTSSSRRIIAEEMLAAFPEFGSRFSKFLEDHGHCEIEFDAMQPPWRDAPWVVLDNVRAILSSPMQQTPAQREREVKIEAQQAELRLYNLVPADLHFFYHEVIRLARTYTALDDLEHYETARLNRPLRRALRELGRRLVARGVIKEPMHIFHAHRDQLRDAVNDGSSAAWTTLRHAITAQHAAYLSDAAREPEWVLGEPAPAPDEGECLSGLPGSPGIVEGEAYSVLSTDDFAGFPKGAILIARTTSPAWTPLFYIASAVVTASGGPLSHGAVTAREMRIPAVMAVRDCVSRFKNGQRVRVDGTSGRVYAL
jgi:pyruvate,water dikinase